MGESPGIIESRIIENRRELERTIGELERRTGRAALLLSIPARLIRELFHWLFDDLATHAGPSS